MALEVQVTFDCADPAALAEFWALALGYVVQPAPPPFASWDEALDAWDVPPDSTGPRGRRPHGRAGAALRDAGLSRGDAMDAGIIVMADPEGNEFCLD